MPKPKTHSFPFCHSPQGNPGWVTQSTAACSDSATVPYTRGITRCKSSLQKAIRRLNPWPGLQPSQAFGSLSAVTGWGCMGTTQPSARSGLVIVTTVAFQAHHRAVALTPEEPAPASLCPKDALRGWSTGLIPTQRYNSKAQVQVSPKQLQK